MNREVSQEGEYHVPVLLHASVDHLVSNTAGVYVDLTYGGGGHSKEILNRLNSNGKLMAFDQDEDAIKNKIDDDRLTLIKSNFRFFENHIRYLGIEKVDGIIADLGVSSHQFDKPERGFSVRFDEPLDMRMDTSQKLSAYQVFNEYSEENLARVFYLYGELRNAKLLASKIIDFRKNQSIITTDDLKSALKNVVKPAFEKDMLVLIFQSVRIEVNHELDALKDMLIQAASILKKEGRLVIISYHSLEDRLVKNYFKAGNFDGIQQKDLYGNVLAPLHPMFSKPIIPDMNEIKINPRSRSAKMRIGIKNT